MIEFIFNEEFEMIGDFIEEVSILVLIEFIFNIKVTLNIFLCGLSLNPCFDRIYFQLYDPLASTRGVLGLNPCFDRIYFQLLLNFVDEELKRLESQSLF